MTPLKTGIFSGSFNPIHIGHLALANHLCEHEDLDELWFMVSPQNPWKPETELWDDNLRLQLVEASIEGYARFRASDFEFGLPRPSYTAHTLEALSQTHPDREFILIIGADNWLNFDRWHRPQHILDNYRVWVYPRPGFEVDATKLPSGVRWISAPTFEISSTHIRQDLKEGKDLRYFMHPNAWELLQTSIHSPLQ